jgi:hypothetical protein
MVFSWSLSGFVLQLCIFSFAKSFWSFALAEIPKFMPQTPLEPKENNPKLMSLIT